MTEYIFHRSDTFYFVHLKDDADARVNAQINKGALKVENAITGQIVWDISQQSVYE